MKLNDLLPKRRIFYFLLLLLIILVSALNGENEQSEKKERKLKAVDIDLSVGGGAEGRNRWIDPGDPLAHLTANRGPSLGWSHSGDGQFQCDCSLQMDKLREELSDCRIGGPLSSTPVDGLMKLVLRRFLVRLGIREKGAPSSSEEHGVQSPQQNADVVKLAQIRLSADNLRTIRQYLASERASEEMALRVRLRDALDGFITEIENRSEHSLFTWLRSLAPFVTLANLLVLPPAVYLLLREFVSVRRTLTIVFIMAFFTSCYFTYARKYQEVLAQRFERMQRMGGEAGARGHNACHPQGLMSEAFNVLLGYVRIKEKSDCLRSYEDMLIEPIWLVDPLQVVGEVLANFFLSPLTVAGKHLNTFLRDFFIDTPLHLALVKLLLVPAFIYLALYFLVPELVRWALVPGYGRGGAAGNASRQITSGTTRNTLAIADSDSHNYKSKAETQTRAGNTNRRHGEPQQRQLHPQQPSTSSSTTNKTKKAPIGCQQQRKKASSSSEDNTGTSTQSQLVSRSGSQWSLLEQQQQQQQQRNSQEEREEGESPVTFNNNFDFDNGEQEGLTGQEETSPSPSFAFVTERRRKPPGEHRRKQWQQQMAASAPNGGGSAGSVFSNSFFLSDGGTDSGAGGGGSTSEAFGAEKR